MIWPTALNYTYCVCTLKRSVGTDESSSSSFTFFRISCQSASLFKDLMAWVKRKENSEWSHLPSSFPSEYIVIKPKVCFVLFQLPNTYLFKICANTFLLKSLLFSSTFECVTKRDWSQATLSHPHAAQSSFSETTEITSTPRNTSGDTYDQNTNPQLDNASLFYA